MIRLQLVFINQKKDNDIRYFPYLGTFGDVIGTLGSEFKLDNLEWKYSMKIFSSKRNIYFHILKGTLAPA